MKCSWNTLKCKWDKILISSYQYIKMYVQKLRTYLEMTLNFCQTFPWACVFQACRSFKKSLKLNEHLVGTINTKKFMNGSYDWTVKTFCELFMNAWNVHDIINGILQWLSCLSNEHWPLKTVVWPIYELLEMSMDINYNLLELSCLARGYMHICFLL